MYTESMMMEVRPMPRNYKSSFNERLRKSTIFKEWREKVFKRDNYACVDCGSTKELHPHHIKSFAESPALRFQVDNGKTLCSKCHGKEHGMNFSKLGRYLTCKMCGIRFRPKSGHLNQKTCSKKCGYILRSTKINPKKGKHYPHLRKYPMKNCLNCSKEFKATVHKTRNQKYCSRECYLKNRWEKVTGLKAKKQENMSEKEGSDATTQ